MKMIHVHSDGTEYQVVRIAPEEPPELVLCDSPEELVSVLRGLGVEVTGVAHVLDELEDRDVAEVRM